MIIFLLIIAIIWFLLMTIGGNIGIYLHNKRRAQVYPALYKRLPYYNLTTLSIDVIVVSFLIAYFVGAFK
jgi:hypothetical protein